MKKLLVVFAIILAVAIGCSVAQEDEPTLSQPTNPPAASEPAETEAEPEPALEVTAAEMIETLEANALNAKETYEGKRVTVSGVVGNIDASGNYFSLDPEPDAFIITGVQVQTSEEFRDQVAAFTQGQEVVVTGTVTSVGEIMGYSIEAESIQ